MFTTSYEPQERHAIGQALASHLASQQPSQQPVSHWPGQLSISQQQPAATSKKMATCSLYKSRQETIKPVGGAGGRGEALRFAAPSGGQGV